jgi:hypothetical protein
MPGSTISLGLDISKDALRQAARRWPTPVFAVTDLWGEWPVHDAAADLVINIFAPKNFPEMRRVLRPAGWLAAAPIEPRDRFGLLRRHEKIPSATPIWPNASSARPPSRCYGAARFSSGHCTGGDPDGSLRDTFREANVSP